MHIRTRSLRHLQFELNCSANASQATNKALSRLSSYVRSQFWPPHGLALGADESRKMIRQAQW